MAETRNVETWPPRSIFNGGALLPLLHFIRLLQPASRSGGLGSGFTFPCQEDPFSPTRSAPRFLCALRRLTSMLALGGGGPSSCFWQAGAFTVNQGGKERQVYQVDKHDRFTPRGERAPGVNLKQPANIPKGVFGKETSCPLGQLPTPQGKPGRQDEKAPAGRRAPPRSRQRRALPRRAAALRLARSPSACR